MIKTINQLVLVAILILVSSCQNQDDEKSFLKKALHELSTIKSVSYYSTSIGTLMGDTTKYTAPYTKYIKVYMDSADTLVGASNLVYAENDTTKVINFYDGKVKGSFEWEKKTVKVDSFQNNPAPYRMVDYSMYSKVNEIIKYTLTTQDSIQTDYSDFGDSIRFSLKIYNQHVYFHIKPIVIKNNYIPEDEITKYDIWFHKSDYLPYKMRSKWYHATYIEESKDAKFNTRHEVKFVSSDIIPADFEIVQIKQVQRKTQKNYEGKRAPDWILKDIDGNNIGLNNLKCKVIMIQFTGIGCGPCHESLPFLKQLVVDYADKDFQFVSIETWSQDIEALTRYKDKNEINFTFIRADKQIQKDYEIRAVPVFFILDKDRIIRKVINGYSESSTDETILKTINELL